MAFEVEASERVDPRSLAALRSLREALGDAFVAGVVLFTGRRSYPIDDRLHAVPVDRLWT